MKPNPLPHRRRPAQRAATPASAPSPGTKLWQVVLAGFGLLTALLFLLGAGVTQVVFWFWGLDFLQIASRDDIVRSGLSLLLRATPLIAAGAAAALTAWLHKGTSLRKYLMGCLVALVLMGFSIPFGKTIAWLAIAPFEAAIGAMMVGIVVLRRERGEAIGGERWTGLAALFSIAVVLASLAPAIEIIAGGYFDHRVQLIAKPVALAQAPAVALTESAGTHAKSQKIDRATRDAPATCENYAVWIGDKAMVLDCEPKPMRRLKLVYGVHDFEARLDRRGRPRTLWNPPAAEP